MCTCLHAASPLEGYGPNEWVAFERALVVRDIFTGGVRTFLSTQDAQAFRALIYKQYSELPPLPPPLSGNTSLQLSLSRFDATVFHGRNKVQSHGRSLRGCVVRIVVWLLGAAAAQQRSVFALTGESRSKKTPCLAFVLSCFWQVSCSHVCWGSVSFLTVVGTPSLGWASKWRPRLLGVLCCRGWGWCEQLQQLPALPGCIMHVWFLTRHSKCNIRQHIPSGLSLGSATATFIYCAQRSPLTTRPYLCGLIISCSVHSTALSSDCTSIKLCLDGFRVKP